LKEKYETDDFFKSRIHLTALYQLIIIVVLAIFSAIILIQTELQTEKTKQRFSGDNYEYDDYKKWDDYKGKSEDFIDELQKEMEEILFVLNLLIISASLYLSYMLAWKTLAPIKQKITEQNEFLSDVSHELRNPLSAIKLTADSMQSETDIRIKDAKEVFSDISSETSRLITMSESLLGLLSIDSHEWWKKEVITISTIVKHCKKVLNIQLKEKNITLNINKNKEYTIEAQKEDIFRVVFNLLENAIKFSKKNSKIVIEINKKSFSIQDYGIGMSEKDQKKIFDRFYKVDSSRSFEYSGTWLWLAIVKKLLLKYWLTIKANSKKGEWTIFIVS